MIYRPKHALARAAAALSWRVRVLIFAGVAGLAGLGGMAASPVAGATTATTTASTQITDRLDSSYSAQPAAIQTQFGPGSYWAKDSMTRTVSVTLVGLHSGAECGTLSPCYQYTGSVTDTDGTFTTLTVTDGTNAVSPAKGVALVSPPVKGTFTGAAEGFTFYADSNAPDASGVPATVTGNGPTDTSDWIKLIFPGTVHFNGSLLPDWSWTYKDAGCESWTDAYTDGTTTPATGVGDITGADNCADTVTVTSPGAQSWTVGQAVSLPIKASTSDSNASITSYAATGLPAGLTIDSSTGVISGKPATASSFTATVTATDSRGTSGQATFSWTVGSTVVAPPPAVGTVSSFSDYGASCLDNRNFTWKAFNPIQLWTCGAAGGADQQLKLVTLPGATHQVLEFVTSARGGPWCVTVPPGRSKLVLGVCSVTAANHVNPGAFGQGVVPATTGSCKCGVFYMFANDGSLAMDDLGWNTKNGALVGAWSFNGGRNQGWSQP